MHSISRSALILTLPVVALLAAAPATAGGVSFSLGAGFSVGNLSIQLAYASPDYGYLPYYYRTPVALHYPGYACTTGCLKSSSYYYHAPGCPLLLHYFSLYEYVGYVEHYHVHNYYPPSYRYRHSYPRTYHPHRSYRHYGYSSGSRHYGSAERSRPSYRGRTYPRSRHESYRHETHRVEDRHRGRERELEHRVDHRGRRDAHGSRGHDYRSRDDGHHRGSSVKGHSSHSSAKERSSHRGRDSHRDRGSGRARRSRSSDH